MDLVVKLIVLVDVEDVSGHALNHARTVAKVNVKDVPVLAKVYALVHVKEIVTVPVILHVLDYASLLAKVLAGNKSDT